MKTLFCLAVLLPAMVGMFDDLAHVDVGSLVFGLYFGGLVGMAAMAWANWRDCQTCWHKKFPDGILPPSAKG